MRKVDSLYSSLIEIISNICDDNSIVENFWTSLDEEQRTVFDDLLDLMALEKTKIERCKNEIEIYTNHNELNNYFSEFNKKFSNYPSICYKKVKYILMLLDKIFQNIEEIVDEDISSSFIFNEVELQYESKAFITNMVELTKNIIWFNPALEESLDKLMSLDSNIECWYTLLSKADSIDFDCGKELLFCDSLYNHNGMINNNIISLLKFHMASSGEKIIPSLSYSRKPINTSLDSLCPSKSYDQFDDIINILGEYNNRSDSLTKYLSIFHIIENFMFKQPIVKLERSTSGDMFSIRDFRRLYRNVEKKEKEGMLELFKSSFSLTFNGETFGAYAFRTWEEFKVTHHQNLTEIESFIEKLSVAGFNNVRPNDIGGFLSRLIYQIRCSIVHNKETEVHVSSENYYIGCKLLIEEYLLFTLENLIFLLMSQENELVWYQSDHIRLWRKTA